MSGMDTSVCDKINQNTFQNIDAVNHTSSLKGKQH